VVVFGAPLFFIKYTYIYGKQSIEIIMKDLVLEGRELLEKFISDSINEEETDISKSTNVRVILDNNLATVVIPRNYQAVREIMEDTKWVNVFSNIAFTRYQKQKYTMYFIVLKKASPNFNNAAMKKMAVVISPSGEYTCYDTTGALIDINNVIKTTNISRTLFKQIR
jgi:hypothetical protein